MSFFRKHLGVIVVVMAAVLVELTTAAMYYTAQHNVQKTMEKLVDWEMTSIYRRIRGQFAQVEVTVNNMAWVASNNLEKAEWMYEITEEFVRHNPTILSSSVAFVPDYYPEQGYWFEPFSVRRCQGQIETMQLGSAHHDYTQMPFFTEPIAQNSGYWSVPYEDPDGAQAYVISYGYPVHDKQGAIVGVMTADLSLDWLEELTQVMRYYKRTYRFLVDGNYRLLAGSDNVVFRDVVARIQADADSTYYTKMRSPRGKKLHIFHHPIGGTTDWILISVLDDSEVFGTLRRVRMLLLLLIVIGLVPIGYVIFRTLSSMERLRVVNEEKERIGGELRVASEIQQSMLPHEHLRHDDVEICGSLVPAREVGGDLYDYFVRDEKLFFCIGDVSGKGAPSAMLMGVIHSLFRAFFAHQNSPAHVMKSINENSCRGNESNMFVTLFIGVLDLPTGHLRFCNAGHDKPIILLPDKAETESMECEAHLPVGVFDDVNYTEQSTYLQPGSTLFLYTDGLTEAKNKERRQFGLERILTILGACAAQTPQAVVETVMQSVHEFVGDAEQSDDLTLLVIRYLPKRLNSTLSETLVLKNDIHEIQRFSTFIKDVTARLNIVQPLAGQLRLAVEEAVVNVMEYAYPIGTEGEVSIHAESDGQVLRVTITDTGVAFDPTTKEEADTSLPAEDRQIGGLGILLVRELMDSINYERINAKNVLTLTKKL